MNAIQKTLPLLAILLLISGCASTISERSVYAPDAPTPDNFTPSLQRQLNASNHWSAIASDLANQLKLTLNKKQLDNRPLYLNLYSEDTEFSGAFNDFLTTHLVKKGLMVSKRKSGATIYNYKVNTIKFKSFRTTTQTSKSRWTALAAGVAVLTNVWDIGSADLIAIASGVDFFQNEKAPNLEIIISSSILSNDIYLHKSSDIYYANAQDIHLYRQQNQSTNSDVFQDPFYQ